GGVEGGGGGGVGEGGGGGRVVMRGADADGLDGAVVMQRARARWSTETIVTAAIAVLGVMTATIAAVHTLWGLVLVMLVSGGAWIAFISLTNALVQTLAPDWVRARVLAIFILITHGALAAGSVVWGAVGSQVSLDAALIASGVATLGTTRWPSCSDCRTTPPISRPGTTGDCRQSSRPCPV